MVSASMPVIGAARSGGHSATRASQLLGAQRVAREIVVVLQPFGEEDVHHGQRERGIGAGTDAEPFVALRRGAGANRVDGDDVRAALLRREDRAARDADWR